MRDSRALILLLRLASRALLALAWAALAAWIIGRAVSDRFLWSQFVLWLPSWIIVPGAAACLGLSAALARLGFPRYEQPDPRDRSWTRARPGVRSARWRAIAWGMFALVGLGMFLGEWRLFNALRSDPPAASRLLVWNCSDQEPLETIYAAMIDPQPDVVLLANPPMRRTLEPVTTAMGPATGAVVYGRMAVLSKYPVMRWAGCELQITGAKLRKFTWAGGGMLSIDRGQALLVQLDATRDLGRPIVVWFIDLPSDPDIPRDRMMREARGTLDNLTAYIMRESGRDVPDTWRDPATNPLRSPDIIAGDTNTPRGSRSLRVLNRLADEQLTGAYEQAGWGPSLTYPRAVPLLAIDHIFTRPWLRAVRYETTNPGVGRHRLQVADLVPR